MESRIYTINEEEKIDVTTSSVDAFIAEYLTRFKLPARMGQFVCNIAKLKKEEPQEEPQEEPL